MLFIFGGFHFFHARVQGAAKVRKDIFPVMQPLSCLRLLGGAAATGGGGLLRNRFVRRQVVVLIVVITAYKDLEQFSKQLLIYSFWHKRFRPEMHSLNGAVLLPFFRLVRRE